MIFDLRNDLFYGLKGLYYREVFWSRVQLFLAGHSNSSYIVIFDHRSDLLYGLKGLNYREVFWSRVQFFLVGHSNSGKFFGPGGTFCADVYTVKALRLTPQQKKPAEGRFFLLWCRASAFTVRHKKKNERLDQNRSHINNYRHLSYLTQILHLDWDEIKKKHWTKTVPIWKSISKVNLMASIA